MNIKFKKILTIAAIMFSYNSWAAPKNIDFATAVVTSMQAMTEKCNDDQPSFKEKIDEALSQWEKRNEKYVEFSKKQEYFNEVKEIRRKFYNKENKKFSEEQCLEAIQHLNDTKNDVEKIRM